MMGDDVAGKRFMDLSTASVDVLAVTPFQAAMISRAKLSGNHTSFGQCSINCGILDRRRNAKCLDEKS